MQILYQTNNRINNIKIFNNYTIHEILNYANYFTLCWCIPLDPLKERDQTLSGCEYFWVQLCEASDWLGSLRNNRLPLTFQHHDGAALRQGEGRGRLSIRGLQRREHLRLLGTTPDSCSAPREGAIQPEHLFSTFLLIHRGAFPIISAPMPIVFRENLFDFSSCFSFSFLK